MSEPHPSDGTAGPALTPSRRKRSSVALLSLAAMLTPALALVTAAPALANTVASASFSSTYAKPGSDITLTVTTDPSKCVAVSGTYSTTSSTTGTATKTNWTFPFKAGSGEGAYSVGVRAFDNSNCNGNGGTTVAASYQVDSKAPTVSGSLAPTPNQAGWNNNDVKITWSAQDASPVTLDPPTTTVATETTSAGASYSSTATDAAGNQGTGSVTVKLDRTKPVVNPRIISGSPNAAGWYAASPKVSASPTDGISGVKTKDADKTVGEGAGQTVTMSATDNADNTGSDAVTGVNVDLTDPSLTAGVSAAPGTGPNAAGWYRGDVTVRWTAADALSGLNAPAPADNVITGEGAALTRTQTVTDKAGRAKTVTSAPVKIDRTAPITDVAAPAGWTNKAQTLTLAPKDALSGAAGTFYKVDGGAPQAGTSVGVSGDGTHSVEYWSVDAAGNEEQVALPDGTKGHKTVAVKIDGTSPTIQDSQAPAANANGWNNGDVTVSFVCADSLSGIASCTTNQVITQEGAEQQVEGKAVDNAGNTASAKHKVDLDRTAPVVNVATDRPANGNGWYDNDVVVTTTATDALSGVDTSSGPQTLVEGGNQTATGRATDAAGNAGSASKSGINVDQTAPLLSGAPVTAPNANGWYTGDVPVTWTASDALSGLDGPAPGGSTITGEGRGQSASATVADKAGHSTGTSVSADIDRTAPHTAATVPAPLNTGWYAGPVAVALTGNDALSGVDETFYSVDGGPAQPYTAPFTHDLKGEHTITYWSTDKAGLTEDKAAASNTITLKIDGIAPTINGTRMPAANANGWVNQDVTVSFACADAESGIASCPDTTVVSNEAADQSVDGDAQDIAGNRASASVGGISIDRTAPTLSGNPTGNANAAGWYKGDVTVAWDARDGLSGIDPATQPANAVLTGEGRDLGAGPVAVTDKAGNRSAPASVRGIQIDRKAPVVTVAKPAPNAAGWYTGDVLVGYSCSDPVLADGSAGSGVAACPSDQLISGNGSGQSVTSDPAADLAGNSAARITTGGINIDGLPPMTTADNQCSKTNGYCTGSTATVVLTSTDQAGLSGVKEIRYSVNGAAEQVAGPGSGLTVNATTGVATAAVNVPLDGSGAASVSYYAVDKADNKEQSNGVALKYDNIAPTISHVVSPKPNADEWNNSDVTVTFTASDNDTGSGLASVSAPRTMTAETPGTTVTGVATDVAGNKATDDVLIKLDRTAPSNTPTVTPAAGVFRNAAGWYNGPVTVSFTCADALSTIAVCPDPVTVTANGSSDVVREAKDKAGNITKASVLGLKIDDAAPKLATSSVKNGAIYTLGAEPAPSCTGDDGLTGSGVASCTVVVTPATAGGKVGAMNYTATVTDNAGNTTVQKGAYRVVYRYDGFLQPITDTNHDSHLTAISTFKAGQTVPAKFQVKKADGTPVQAAELPGWATPIKGGLTLAQVNVDGSTTALGDSGADFRWDPVAQQYIYNYKTAATQAGSRWTIGVVLDDGNTYPVTLALQ